MIAEKTFQVICQTLENLGYVLSTVLFKAKDFGVPQNRERIYLVGFAKDKVTNYADFNFPTPPRTPTKLGDILEENVDEKYNFG